MMATFVTIFQIAACTQRNFVPKSFDNKYLYFIYGMLSGFSVLIERKSRRTELTLYTLPKATESFLRIMTNRKWLFTVDNLDVWMTSIAMAFIMV